MFTLQDPRPLGAGLLQADWPHTLIQEQSRRHYRVSGGLAGLSMTLPGMPDPVCLHDISEEGVGLLLRDGRPLPRNDTGSMLHLGELSLPVPRLQRVHARPVGGPGAARLCGARLIGMSAEHVRQLRCWLAARQARSLVPPADQG
jgi:hypothetical protein